MEKLLRKLNHELEESKITLLKSTTRKECKTVIDKLLGKKCGRSD